jgi:steroid 5-alpha reductase family enzyme
VSQVFLTAACVLVIYMLCIFLLALRLKDNSIVDIAYGLAFITAASAAAFAEEASHPRFILLYTMVILWGLRLAVHLLFRKRGHGEDFRYRKWREEWGSSFLIRSFFQIYILQGIVVLIVASPVLHTAARPGAPLGALDLAGVCIWTAGFLFEAVGDWQLLRFKRDPLNKGKIITTGLWRYTRHPNYFGECSLWWGVYLVALGSPGAWWTIISPLSINFLLLYVSGIPMLEKKYEGNPAFEDYKRRTSPLIPWFFKT